MSTTKVIGQLQLRWSWACHGNWSRVVLYGGMYSSPVTIEQHIDSEGRSAGSSDYGVRTVMPAVLRIDSDADARHAVFGGSSNEKVASSIFMVMEYAREQSWNYGGFWGGARELPVAGFTRKHATEDKFNGF